MNDEVGGAGSRPACAAVAELAYGGQSNAERPGARLLPAFLFYSLILYAHVGNIRS